jgi:hypothetical protein
MTLRSLLVKRLILICGKIDTIPNSGQWYTEFGIFFMSIELQCYILLFQSQMISLRNLVQAEQVKEYEAEWLDSGKTINRDRGGKFAKKNPAEKLGDKIAQTTKSATEVLNSIQKTSDITLEVASNLLLDSGFRQRAGLVAGMNLANSIKLLAEYARVNPGFITKFDEFNDRCLKHLAEQYSDTELAKFLKPDPIPQNIPFAQHLELQAAQFQACKEFFELPRTPEQKILIGQKVDNLANLLKAGVGVLTATTLAIAPEFLFGMFFAGGMVPGISYLLTSFTLTSAASYFTDKTLDLFNFKEDSTLRHVIQITVDIGSALVLSKVSTDLINDLPKIKEAILDSWETIKAFKKAVSTIKNHELTDFRMKNLPGESKRIVVNSLTYVFKRENFYRNKLIDMGIEESLIDDAIVNSKKIIDNSRMMIRSPSSVASEILDDRFKSNFEMHHRSSTKGYQSYRKEVEGAALGIKDVLFNKKFPDHERPIYGFLVDGSDPISGSYKKEGSSVDSYGNISFIINNAVKKTSFFTATDTFQRPISSPMETSGILAFLPTLFKKELSDIDLTNKFKIERILRSVKNSKNIEDLRQVGAIGVRDNKPRYLEFQSFGKVTNKDISGMVVHSSVLGSKNTRLSLEVFGKDADPELFDLIKKAKKKGIGVFYEENPDSATGYVTNLRDAAKYDKHLDVFKEGSSLYSHPTFGFNPFLYDSITKHFQKLIHVRQSSAIDFRHNLLREISSNLHDNPVFSKTTDYDLSRYNDWVHRKSMFKEGLTRHMTQEGWDEYRQTTKTMIEKIKDYDPSFFHDFKKYTGFEIDFELESSYIPF